MKTTKPVLNAIVNLNLEPIKNKLMDPEHGEGWSRAKVDAMDLEYRRFLHLMHTFPNQPASPTKAVDTFWHYHILDTQRYAADCEAVFGYFMHHNPNSDSQGVTAGTNSGDLMQKLYETTFGEAYIRREAYYADDAINAAPAKFGKRSVVTGRVAVDKATVCQTFCGMQANQASAKMAVCQTFCGMQAKPSAANAAVCQTFCGMRAKPSNANTAVCQTFCGMYAKPAGPEGPVCQIFSGIKSKSASGTAFDASVHMQ